MPRIPTRTTPYETPDRQQRHFKAKRHQMLRLLSKASYVSSSQFAIVWVSARGEPETYASPALQDLIKQGDVCLFPEAAMTRAVAATKEAAEAAREAIANGMIPVEPAGFDNLDAEARRLGKGKRRAGDSDDEAVEELNYGDEDEDDKDGDVTMETDLSLVAVSASTPSTSPLPKRLRSSVSPIKGSPSKRATGSVAPSSASSQRIISQVSKMPSPPSTERTTSSESIPADTSESTEVPAAPQPDADVIPPTPSQEPMQAPVEAVAAPKQAPAETLAAAGSSQPASVPFSLSAPPVKRSVSGASAGSNASNRSVSGTHSHTTTFYTPASLYFFMKTKFEQLQTQTCKIVARQWLKMVEPKKQSFFPYNGGEEGRPPWWPDEVPHREPDHLSKDQRVRLLMVLLGCGRVPIRNFEAALPEVVTSLKTEKLDIMRDIFKVAKEEERLRILNPTLGFQAFTVELAPARSGYETVPFARESSARERRPSGLVGKARDRSLGAHSRRNSTFSSQAPSPVIPELGQFPSTLPAAPSMSRGPSNMSQGSMPPAQIRHPAVRYEGGLFTPSTGGLAAVEAFPGPRFDLHAAAPLPPYTGHPVPQHPPAGPSNMPLPSNFGLPLIPISNTILQQRGTEFDFTTLQSQRSPVPADVPWSGLTPTFFEQPFGFDPALAAGVTVPPSSAPIMAGPSHDSMFGHVSPQPPYFPSYGVRDFDFTLPINPQALPRHAPPPPSTILQPRERYDSGASVPVPAISRSHRPNQSVQHHDVAADSVHNRRASMVKSTVPTTGRARGMSLSQAAEAPGVVANVAQAEAMASLELSAFIADDVVDA